MNKGIAMQLPGGLMLEGRRWREYRFKKVTGALEMALVESVDEMQLECVHITDTLCVCLDTLGPHEATRTSIEQLCTGDRRFLMYRLAAHIDDQPIWLTARCAECKQQFDVSYYASQLPVQSGCDDYPWIDVDTSAGPVRLRLPTGVDQKHIGDIDDEKAAIRALIEQLIEDGTDAVDADAFTDADVAAIENAVEAASPEIATDLLVACPDCELEQKVAVQAPTVSAAVHQRLLGEVHSLAQHYHWDEQAILSLPRNRRQIYLQMIDTSRGMHASADDFIHH